LRVAVALATTFWKKREASSQNRRHAVLPASQRGHKERAKLRRARIEVVKEFDETPMVTGGNAQNRENPGDFRAQQQMRLRETERAGQRSTVRVTSEFTIFQGKCRWRRITTAAALLFCVWFPDRAFALDLARSVFHCNSQTWRRQSGLTANGINSITQTRDGYLWLGTSAGLVRFDGSEFKLLDMSPSVKTRSASVRTVAGALGNDPKGRHLPVYLAQLSEQLRADQEAMAGELDSLPRNIEHINEIVAMQQSYATFGGVKEIVDVAHLVEDSLRINEEALRRHHVEVIREFEPVPSLNSDGPGCGATFRLELPVDSLEQDLISGTNRGTPGTPTMKNTAKKHSLTSPWSGREETANKEIRTDLNRKT
jgi:hypothetical protein